jgi:hypothetical protein
VNYTYFLQSKETNSEGEERNSRSGNTWKEIWVFPKEIKLSKDIGPSLSWITQNATNNRAMNEGREFTRTRGESDETHAMVLPTFHMRGNIAKASPMLLESVN